VRATDFTHDDYQLGDRRVTYATLKREYVCEECGGRLGVYYSLSLDLNYDPDAWAIRCGRCHSQRFIHERRWQAQKTEAAEVLAGLPPELRELVE